MTMCQLELEMATKRPVKPPQENCWSNTGPAGSLFANPETPFIESIRAIMANQQKHSVETQAIRAALTY